MSRSLNVQLFVPTAACSPERVELLVHALLAAGFAFEHVPGGGAHYWADFGEGHMYHGPSSLTEALAAYRRSSTWGLTMRRPMVRSDGREFEITLDIARPAVDEPGPVVPILLSSSPPPLSPQGMTMVGEFQALAKFAAGLTRAWYGWAGSDFGLFSGSVESIAKEAVAALELQDLEWMNFYGRPYVERLGLDRLLSAPAWGVEFLASGGVMVALAPDIAGVSRDAAEAVADHLGVPVALPERRNAPP